MHPPFENPTNSLDFSIQFRYDIFNHSDAGNSNLADKADSEPERVEDRQRQVKGVPKLREERSSDGLSKVRYRSKADPLRVKQGGTAGADISSLQR